MKTYLSLMTVALLATGQVIRAQNPIPSWDVVVNHEATFEECQSEPALPDPSSKGKRTMYVRVKGSGNPVPCQATVWVYSLDLQDILGPYEVQCEETLAVEIDEREWGVQVWSAEPVTVDVWIEEGEQEKDGK